MTALPAPSGSASPVRPSRYRHRVAIVGIVALLVILAIIHIGVGARYIGPTSVISSLFSYDRRNIDHRIIVDLRLLRLLCAIVTGAALAVAGALLQSISRNPLGEPHILGLNAGAALAVVMTTAFGSPWLLSPLGKPLIASLGAGLLFCLVIAMASAGKSGLTPVKATLCGIAFSAFASAFTAAILILDEQTLADLRIWLAGDLSGLSYITLQYAAGITAIGLVASMLLAPYLNVLALGDSVATGLGVHVPMIRGAGLVAAALLCGAAVSVAGPVGFIGLIVPHIMRRLVGDDIRILLPMSAIGGATLLLIADIAARTIIAPQELATGVMTALVGAPAFVFIAARSFR